MWRLYVDVRFCFSSYCSSLKEIQLGLGVCFLKIIIILTYIYKASFLTGVYGALHLFTHFHFARATVFLHIPNPLLHLLQRFMFKTRLNPWCSGYPEASCQPHPGWPVIKFWLVDIYILWATGEPGCCQPEFIEGLQTLVPKSMSVGQKAWCTVSKIGHVFLCVSEILVSCILPLLLLLLKLYLPVHLVLLLHELFVWFWGTMPVYSIYVQDLFSVLRWCTQPCYFFSLKVLFAAMIIHILSCPGWPCAGDRIQELTYCELWENNWKHSWFPVSKREK